ncbi:Uncharacterised protein [Vibrio cholerae]|nr:Uncharacterised protein [Vibrio cholerae]
MFQLNNRRKSVKQYLWAVSRVRRLNEIPSRNRG